MHKEHCCARPSSAKARVHVVRLRKCALSVVRVLARARLHRCNMRSVWYPGSAGYVENRAEASNEWCWMTVTTSQFLVALYYN